MATTLWSTVAYAVQLAALAGVAVAATSLLRIRAPRTFLRFWQAVLVMALLLPLAQPRAADPPPISTFVVAAALPGTDPRTPPSGLDYPTIALSIVALGIVARLAWLAIGLGRLRSIVARATPHPSLASLTGELSRALHVDAEVRVTRDLPGPATVGARRPIVLVPPSVLDMSPAVQRAILCHELTHVKRGDWLQTIGEEIWCAVLWFHPLARLIASRLSLARELVVDEATILATRDRRAYAEALLAFSNPQPHVIGVTPFIGRRTLSQRISLIAEEGPMFRRRALVSATIALTASLAITAAAVNRFPMFVTLQAQSTIYKPGNGVSLPKVLKEVKPSYTPEAMKAKIQGSVWMKCVVNEKGLIADCEVTRSLDTEYGLDQAALKAARQWTFEPARKDGKPVAVEITLELTFTLKK